MEENTEKTNPLMGVYALGVIATAFIMYSEVGFWASIGYGLIWPLILVLHFTK